MVWLFSKLHQSSSLRVMLAAGDAVSFLSLLGSCSWELDRNIPGDHLRHPCLCSPRLLPCPILQCPLLTMVPGIRHHNYFLLDLQEPFLPTCSTQSEQIQEHPRAAGACTSSNISPPSGTHKPPCTVMCSLRNICHARVHSKQTLFSGPERISKSLRRKMSSQADLA